MSGVAVGSFIGQRAPEIELPDADGKMWRLGDHRGRVVVVLFYPGDETMTCTRQMCAVRDRWQEYVRAGAEVVAVSMDSIESHDRFRARHKLPLRLLSDADGRIVEAYKARSRVPGFQVARSVFVIDGDRIVRYRKVKPVVGLLMRPNEDEILDAVRSAQEATIQRKDTDDL